MEYVNYVIDLQNNFKGINLERYMLERTEIPVFVVIGYLALVFYFPGVMERKQPMNLKVFFMLWNLILSVFSILGAIHTIPVLVQKFMTHGWFYTICQEPADDYYHDGPVGFWVALFILSKIPELMDTVFLVLQKKPVIFLHWYHHFTVMLFVWYWSRASVFYATMNYAVHAIMYSYYFCMCFKAGRTVVKPIAPLITSLQILQMVFGLVVSILCFVAYSRAQSHGVPCPGQDWLNVFLGTVMYLSYFILFCILFQKNYRSGSKKK